MQKTHAVFNMVSQAIKVSNIERISRDIACIQVKKTWLEYSFRFKPGDVRAQTRRTLANITRLGSEVLPMLRVTT